MPAAPENRADPGEPAVPGADEADRAARVIHAFVGLADTLVDDYDVDDLLGRLVDHCTELLAVDAAAVLLSDAQQVLHAAARSGPQVQALELAQLDAGEGPCVEAFDTARQVRVPDLTRAPDRWPAFTEAARSGPFASVHAVPLRLRDHAVGALNLFRHAPGPLSEADLALAQALADVATIGILQERTVRHRGVRIEHLQTALDTRIVVEQAKGRLAERRGIDVDAAFDLLRRHARSTNQRLADVARSIVHGGFDIPAPDIPAPDIPAPTPRDRVRP